MEIIVSCVLFKPLLTPKTHFALVDKSQGQIDTMLAHLLSDLAGLASAAGNQCLLVLFKPGQASAAGSTKKPELFFLSTSSKHPNALWQDEKHCQVNYLTTFLRGAPI